MKKSPSIRILGVLPGLASGDQSKMGGGNAPMSPDMGMVDDKDEIGGMPMGSENNTSPVPAPAMGMGEMGSGGNTATSAMPPAVGGMATMRDPSSAMLGQAGPSHLYHIGSNGFFLNHSRYIILTPDLRLTLNHLKEKAMLDRSSDQPDSAKIQAKVVEIKKLRGDQHMNFIRAGADASNVLMPEQRKSLLGTMAATRK
ncbi:MAG: hypothetical protein Q8S55_09690 [Methylococcaceae bacterium]|nr:hypothetical protein [Methylococcaceae bacterium]